MNSIASDELCEGCESPAVTTDPDGISLCAECAKLPNEQEDIWTPYKRAFEAWCEKEGAQMCDASTLQSRDTDYYLSNRLKNAFQAGYNAAIGKVAVIDSACL